MLYLKIMSDQEMPDDDRRKNFSVIPIGPRERVVFVADMSYPEDDPHVCALIGPWAGTPIEGFDIPESEKDRVHPLTGTAYLLSESGKTIASRAAH